MAAMAVLERLGRVSSCMMTLSIISRTSTYSKILRKTTPLEFSLSSIKKPTSLIQEEKGKKKFVKFKKNPPTKNLKFSQMLRSRVLGKPVRLKTMIMKLWALYSQIQVLMLMLLQKTFLRAAVMEKDKRRYNK